MAPGSMMTKKIILRQFLKMFLLWKWARAWGKAKGLRREVAHDQVIIFSMFGCLKSCNRIFVDQILDNNIDDRSWPGVPARCMLPSGKSTADGGRPLVIEHYRSPGMAFGRSKYLSVLDSPIITISMSSTVLSMLHCGKESGSSPMPYHRFTCTHGVLSLLTFCETGWRG